MADHETALAELCDHLVAIAERLADRILDA